MTTENRRLVSLDEIVSIEYACAQCGTAVSVPREKKRWKSVPCSCPSGCTTVQGGADVWFDPASPEYKAVQQLVNAVDSLVSIKQDRTGCTLRLELRPEAD
jgi:hypothetical protein